MLHDSLKHNEEVKPNSFELEKLRHAFPDYFDADSHFMMDRFTSMLNSGDVQLSKEGYELKFLGKSYAKYQAGLETETAIVPDIAHNNLPENKDSRNLYIVGDNLDALQHLVKAYAGQVKCIYIDPPYNTGSDGFVYHDDFGFTAKELVEKIGLEEDEAQRILDMQGKSSHSAWLTFMYPRLLLARELLADDGVIFISIDDNEQANLKLLCDEIFGSTNFIAQLVWERAFSPKNDARFVSNSHDYVLMVARNIEEFSIGRLPRTKEANARYNNPDSDPRGVWISDNMTVKTYNAADDYPITTPSGRVVEPPAGRCWSLSKKSFLERLQDNRIWFGSDGNGVPRIKRFLTELQHDGMTPISILYYKEVGHSQSATQELVKLFDGKGLFEGPKPIGLIRRLLTMANLDADSLILDFFSGSATTAQAVMELNAEDGGNRRYIMVQWPEKIPESKPAYQAGYRTIDEIGRERIKRASTKIKEETDAEIDYGFKLVRLETPAQKTLEEMAFFDPNTPATFFDDYVDKFALAGTPGKDVILATWLNRDGYGMTAEAHTVTLDSYAMPVCADSGYLIEQGLSTQDVEKLVLLIEQGELLLNRLVVYPYSLRFAIMHELEKNLSVLRSGQKIEIIKRF